MNARSQMVERFKKFSKYSYKIALVALVVFLISTAINRGSNQVLTIISYISFIVCACTLSEGTILYIMSKIWQ